jgi:outer membrane protein OmpA-like peptidoglycan-associated protein
VKDARRTSTTSGFKSPDEVDTSDGIPTTPDQEDDEPAGDEDTETSFTSLERHMFGSKAFAEGDLVEHDDLTTMLHRRPSDADTMLQRSLHAPPPVQIVTVLPEGARPTDTPAPSAESARPRPQGGLIAAGGVFAGMSFVAAGALVALGCVAAVAIWFLLNEAPTATLPPIGTPVPGVPGTPPAPAPAVPAELVEGIRFPASFAFDDWRVRELDGDALDALVAQLERCPGTIRVTGHTDARGDEGTNDRMAIARAGEVRRILEAHAIDRKRIEIGSAGSAVPTIEENTPQARAKNRRVTVRCD